ncbi:hypothetical protein [Streptomyces sp. NPDC015345]|uniref:hypothetical protein n=1 Tax=Streptomyces sp. NPDC015345 TaxID=3364953 RepID=UPI0037016A13
MGGRPVAGDARSRTEAAGSGRAEAATAALRPTSTSPGGGFAEAGVLTEEGASPLGRWTAIPWLCAAGADGVVLAAVVTLTKAAPAIDGPTPALTTHEDGEGGHLAVITWPYGTRSDVPPPPPEQAGQVYEAGTAVEEGRAAANSVRPLPKPPDGS